ncbi:hypothetical protein [Bacteroides sp.]|uniref:hypothetical protein n=1 Tax=Bacteroides sp. TaxID=29523 RepID=UPI003AB132F6
MKWRFNLGMLAIGAVLFASCSSNDDLFDPEKAAQRREAQYTTAFAKLYGEIAPDQDWGFGEKAETRKANTDAAVGNDKTVNMPAEIDETEIAKVVKAFSEPIDASESINVNWTDFWVQQVYTGTAEYVWKDNNGAEHKDKGSRNMDRLVVGKSIEKQEHVNNFNAANGGGTNRMLMQDSSTKLFGYHNSLDGTYHYEYVVLEIDGSYYVGFDFCATGDKNIPGDGIYDDWILKISPAVYKNAKRIIAEDLGGIGDFDFNDVVFDVASHNGEKVITLWAAGGTLPLFIGDTEHEIHALFGVSTTTIVNTGAGTETKAPVVFRLSSSDDVPPIIVESTTAGKYNLKSECGKAPQMICVPTTYEWTDERVAIDTKYPKFKEWVGNTAIDWLN